MLWASEMEYIPRAVRTWGFCNVCRGLKQELHHVLGDELCNCRALSQCSCVSCWMRWHLQNRCWESSLLCLFILFSVFLLIAAMEQNGCFLFAFVGVCVPACRHHCAIRWYAGNTALKSPQASWTSKLKPRDSAWQGPKCSALQRLSSTPAAVGQIPPELVTQHLNKALWF